MTVTTEVKKEYNIPPFVRISRSVSAGTQDFASIFEGFERLESVRETFGDSTEKILSNLKVEIFDRQGFMGVSDEDGHIFASGPYLNEGELWSVYLDAVHELVHVRQFMEGKPLFDSSYVYVDRPTEVEAYRLTVKEARRIGLEEQEIFDYLNVPWITKAQHQRLALACGVVLEKIRLKKQDQKKMPKGETPSKARKGKGR